MRKKANQPKTDAALGLCSQIAVGFIQEISCIMRGTTRFFLNRASERPSDLFFLGRGGGADNSVPLILEQMNRCCSPN